jgi:PAS domain S-box-containing protein
VTYIDGVNLGPDSRLALLAALGIPALATDLDGNICHWSVAAARLYGRDEDEMLGSSMGALCISPENEAIAPSIVVELIDLGRWQGEFEVADAFGAPLRLEARATVLVDHGNRPIGFAATFTDLSGRVAAEQRAAESESRLRRAAVSVDVSGRKDAERALRTERNYHRAVTDSMGEGMFTLDADGTPTYLNPAAQDLLGWPAGALEGSDMHALTHNRRLDGSPLPVEECPILAARRDGKVVRVEDDIFLRPDGSELPVAYTASPFVTEDGIEGCVVVFEDITARKAAAVEIERDLEKLTWVERIQSALKEKRFVLCAQPIISLRTGMVEQRELLIRMLPPQGMGSGRELIPPGSFLPVAEEFGLIGEIDRWVIDRAMVIAATGLPVHVNVSGGSIGSPGLLDHIETAIVRTGAVPGMLVFEITETVLVSDETAARAFVEGLHRAGCKVALDDFGTGYGGFTYLKQLPIDFLKIDVEFVRDMRTSSASRNVVQAIVNLAVGFGLKTVGEGVEDEETLGLLRELGVDYAQGFHIARPGPLKTASQHPASQGVRK